MWGDELLARAYEVWALESSLFLLELMWVALSQRRSLGSGRAHFATYASICVPIFLQISQLATEETVRALFACLQLLAFADQLSQSWLSICLPLMLSLTAVSPLPFLAVREARLVACANALWHAIVGTRHSLYAATAIGLVVVAPALTSSLRRICEAVACELCIIGALRMLDWGVDMRLMSDAPLGTQLCAFLLGIESSGVQRWETWTRRVQEADHLDPALRGTWWIEARGLIPARGFAVLDARRVAGKLLVPLSAPAQRAVAATWLGFLWCCTESLYPPLVMELAHDDAADSYLLHALRLGPLRVVIPTHVPVLTPDGQLRGAAGRAPMVRVVAQEDGVVLLASTGIRRRMLRACMFFVKLPFDASA